MCESLSEHAYCALPPNQMEFAFQMIAALSVCATLIALAALPLGVKYALQVGAALCMALLLHLQWAPMCVYGSTIVLVSLILFTTWVRCLRYNTLVFNRLQTYSFRHASSFLFSWSIVAEALVIHLGVFGCLACRPPSFWWSALLLLVFCRCCPNFGCVSRPLYCCCPVQRSFCCTLCLVPSREIISPSPPARLPIIAHQLRRAAVTSVIIIDPRTVNRPAKVSVVTLITN